MDNDKIITFETPKGYRFKEHLNGKFVFEKFESRPTNIGEAASILNIHRLYIYYSEQLEALQKLLIFRDAWWKMADDWKPDWTNFKVNKFCIGVDRNVTSSCNKVTGNKILAFPTAEMREEFYDAFEELINEVKELL